MNAAAAAEELTTGLCANLRWIALIYNTSGDPWLDLGGEGGGA